MRYLIYKYFLSVCDLCFHYPKSIFQRIEVFNFEEVPFIDIFSSVDCDFGVGSNLSNPRPQRFYHTFSSGSFVVSGLVSYCFRSMNHSELTIVCLLYKHEAWIKVLPFLLLLCIWQYNCFSTICCKDYSFSSELPFHFLSEIHISLHPFLESLFCSIDLFVYLYTNLIVSWLLWLYNKFWDEVWLVRQHFFFFYYGSLGSSVFFISYEF